MAKIFRKIRLNLLSAGKTRNYLKYAIGEIILVVIGILIALQINNLNQLNKDDKALMEYLVKIKSQTQEDLVVIDSLTVYRKDTSRNCKIARNTILDKAEDENLFILMSCGGAFFDYYFRANDGGYEALKSSGYYGKINNTKLDSLLSKYHRLVDEISQNEKSYNQYVEAQEAYISNEFDRSLVMAFAFVPQDSLRLKATSQAEYFEDFKTYTALVPYRNVISLAAFQFDIMIAQYAELKASGKRLIEEINLFLDD